jgi:hypothetical protein
MIRAFLPALSLIVAAPALARPPEAVAQDGSDAPPLAHEFGPQLPIDDGLDTSDGGPLRASGRYSAVGDPGSAYPDNLGAWRITCSPSHTANDDPIVKPGQPGASHTHMFFGNTGTDAFSTYASLRTTGDSTCYNKLWRSAYWAPALLDGPGPDAKVIWPQPGGLIVYYKRFPNYDECKGTGLTLTRCQAAAQFCKAGSPYYLGHCVPLPNGLRNIAGYDMATGKAPTGHTLFKCIAYTSESTGGFSGEWGTDIVAALHTCPPASVVPPTDTGLYYILDLLASMPSCWDGVNLDSPTHRTHVVDFIVEDGVGEWCPKDHPYLIPTYTVQIQYRIDPTQIDASGTWEEGRKTLYLSSDIMPGMTHRPGTTFHFDLFDAGNPTVKKIWNDECTNGFRSCAGGVLGDGSGFVPSPDLPKVQHPKSVRPNMMKDARHGDLRGAVPQSTSIGRPQVWPSMTSSQR